MQSTSFMLKESPTLNSCQVREHWAEHYLASGETFRKETLVRHIPKEPEKAFGPLDLLPTVEFNYDYHNLQTFASFNVVEFLKSKPVVADQSVSLQKWEGIVLSVGEEIFTARLVDLHSVSADEEAEISFDEVPASDHKLICEGAIFYLNIEYERHADGQIKRSVMLRFRRLPAWTKNELLQAKKQTEIIKEKLNW